MMVPIHLRKRQKKRQASRRDYGGGQRIRSEAGHVEFQRVERILDRYRCDEGGGGM